ncbi:hypothetical protein [Actinomadura bangladeshensis]|uniref:Uncharacterized protein n=1 Tax=Actinomadura bangladeshensis TaxID=453573 RepID=A0A6L9QB48_9ACTN|nr:hypothetical protein [Actinomadura bangladeshensis]NEA22621.1 hypothetical protein [Actinomadura bangladeshensis]
MAKNNEIVWCDGTCGLSPEEHAAQHPHPMTVLRAQMEAAVREQLPACAAPAVAEALVGEVLEQIAAHPSLTIRHYAPTKDAYDAACRALEEHRGRADAAEGIVEKVKRLHGKPRVDRAGSGCIQCGVLWPCPTALAVGITAPAGWKNT